MYLRKKKGKSKKRRNPKKHQNGFFWDPEEFRRLLKINFIILMLFFWIFLLFCGYQKWEEITLCIFKLL